MHTLNNKNKIDRANSAAENISIGEEKMSHSSKKTPWFLRFAPGAMNLKSIAATAGLGTIYGLLFAGLLFAPLLPHLEAQTSSTNLVAVQTPPTPQAGGPGFNRAIRTPDGTVYNLTRSTDHLQDGDQIQAVWLLKPTVKRISLRRLLEMFGIGVGSSIVGAAVWNGITKEWDLPPGAASKGRVTARARIGLWKVDGEKTHWYSKSGEWAYTSRWGFNRNDPDDELNTDPDVGSVSSDNEKRDYHYYDVHYQKMMWDEDNEIWKADPDHSRHLYGNGSLYTPARINSRYNRGDPGAYYPGHDDYDKGKKGYFIWIGDHVKNYLSHEFYSAVHSGKNQDLADEAEDEKYKKDKFHPYCLVTVSDMTYTANGWKYKRRAPSKRHRVTRELSAVRNDAKTLTDKEYIPLNARHEETEYFKNNCIIYWSARIKWESANVQVDNPALRNLIIEDQTIPIKYEVPEQAISDYNW